MACDGCDLLIAVGCRFSDRVALKPATFARQAKIVQIDIDRAEINKNVETDHHIIGNAKQVLELLNRKVPQYDHSEWKQYVFSFPTETAYEEDAAHLTPKQILNTIARLCPDDSIVATDVGQHQMWPSSTSALTIPASCSPPAGLGPWLRPGGRHRRQAGQPREDGDPHHRGRLLPDELQRAFHRGVLQSSHHHLYL